EAASPRKRWVNRGVPVSSLRSTTMLSVTDQPETQARHPSRRDPAAPVRVAVVGCGAITRGFHLPVLAGHDGVKVTALVDRDVARAGERAKTYGIGKVLADSAQLPAELADAALVATPPFHHAPCCLDLAGKGIHLFVEKPMAISAAEARAMAEAASKA